ncbi:MAG: DUF2723 domain-containing protein [Bacteroidetes bacterium]|nr:MAG: DUF2723 domain-containing protein [Bacteroidota bacterium]
MKYNRVNNITGWTLCLIATTVYLITMEPTGSFWDCGEFISSCFKLQIPHPPGAPLFVLLGRIFIILSGDNPMFAAKAVNGLSAFASGFTILFLFWSITHFAKKIVLQKNKELTRMQVFTIMSAGAVGALAYTFSDSFWFSAVEGEVYGLSSFFTAIVFWCALKWEDQAKKPGADRWLVLVFFLMGLSIGVHLLNLLTIPAIVMLYYFKRYKPTKWGALIAFAVGCMITGFVMKFVIQYTIKGAGWFDIYGVNELGLPFFAGFAIFFLLLAFGIGWMIRYASRKKYYHLKLGIWCAVFMLIGYSTYLTTMIRSNADPAVDMYNVDNPVNLSSYLGREYYNDWPILFGPDFTDRAPYKEAGDRYVRTRDRYEAAGKVIKTDWTATPSSHFFPRIWDNDNDRQQADCYRRFTGLEEGETPTMADNLKYFAKYQAGWMYMRYFMWNFAGKQNDLQGFGNARDSNWISGIPAVDNNLYGDQSKLPDSIHKENKSYNRLFMLPLILGLGGLFFQYKRKKSDFLINLLLFFFTGMAIVVYLNQSGYQPRERDYTFVGSFYAFAIWIGLGVLWVTERFSKLTKSPLANFAATGLCLLAVPVLMANQEWDDHDRSQKTLARDLAKDYLESCPKNAILFSFEDNDTYPLWYAQEVEGIRPDVRVVVNTLSGTDWYMHQLKYKVNDSDPFDTVFTDEQVLGDRLDAIYYTELPGFSKDQYYDLYDVMKNVVASYDPKNMRESEDGQQFHLYPTKKLKVPVDENIVRANGTADATDKVVSELHLDLGEKNYMLKNELSILSVIAANNWKRPVCFTSTQSLKNLGLDKYTRLDGMSYRLVPVENGNVNNDLAYKNIMQKFAYGSADKKNVYFDEENRRRMNIIKLAHAQVALSLAQAGKKEQAREILERFDKYVAQANCPYGLASNLGNQHNSFSLQFLQACYAADDITLAKKVATSIRKDVKQQLIYYQSLGNEMGGDDQLVNNAYQYLQAKGGNLGEAQTMFAFDILSSYQILRQIDDWEKQFQASGIKS